MAVLWGGLRAAENKAGERRRRRRKRSFYLSPYCIKSCGGQTEPVEPATGDGDGGIEDVTLPEGEKRRPTHLVVTVNGIVGSSANWRYAAKQFVKKYPKDVVVYCSESNYNFLTFDGVDIMGERLALEVLSVVAQRPELRKISFVSHSLGGLVSRYAIALLYGKNILSKSSLENVGDKMLHDSGLQCLNQKSTGRIDGLEPINFITFASPHLGSRCHNQIPILGGYRAVEKLACRISWIAGRSGRHLMLKDAEDGKPPLLLRMVDDWEDLPFLSALQSFKRRVVYSNVCSDVVVGRKTSSIRFQNELPKRENFMKNPKYPHVVHVETPRASSTPSEETETIIKSKSFHRRTVSEMEEKMINGLNRITWERVDVSFEGSIQRIFAHSTIQVKNFTMNSAGADVILHMIDNFLL